jgi:guanosine-3',5'-bis(diphosphate) 3'-pyrophosphohydrolase
MFTEHDVHQLIKATQFAAHKHRFQRRKGTAEIPYFNHPIAVMETLWQVGGVRDMDLLVAALLHDTIEDTETTESEIRAEFGEAVLALVLEVTDDKSLPKQKRKQLQIDHAAHKSPPAKQLKIADKACNVQDIALKPPADWSLERKQAYLNWATAVVDKMRGVNQRLEDHFDALLAEGRAQLEGQP